jgi:hypothetical protein
MSKSRGLFLVALALGVGLYSLARTKPHASIGGIAVRQTTQVPEAALSPPATTALPTPAEVQDPYEPSTTSTLVVTEDRTALRTQPSTKSTILDLEAKGQELVELGRDQDWVHVRRPDTDQQGWMSTLSLTAKAPPPSKDSPSSELLDVEVDR